MALIAALPDALLADACALAAEAGRRRLGEAAPALVALCHRFVGFGVDCVVPEQVAALEALGAIGGPEASRSVSQMIVKGIVQGPNLAAAVIAASRLGVIFPPDFALPLLRHEDPSVRVAACSCVRAGGDVVATLIELLTDLDGEVATAAACALGRLGRVEARHRLKHCLTERPSPRVIESVTGNRRRGGHRLPCADRPKAPRTGQFHSLGARRDRSCAGRRRLSRAEILAFPFRSTMKAVASAEGQAHSVA